MPFFVFLNCFFNQVNGNGGGVNYEENADEALEAEASKVGGGGVGGAEAEDGHNLDYIDEDNEDEDKVVSSPRLNKRKGPFIGGTIDIDVLLGCEASNGPNNLVAFDQSPAISPDNPPPPPPPRYHIQPNTGFFF